MFGRTVVSDVRVRLQNEGSFLSTGIAANVTYGARKPRSHSYSPSCRRRGLIRAAINKLSLEMQENYERMATTTTTTDDGRGRVDKRAGIGRIRGLLKHVIT